MGQELLAKDAVINEHTRASNERFDKRFEKLSEKKKSLRSLGKTALLIIYILLLALAVCMFIWRSFFVNIVQIIFGALLIADGVSGVITVTAAYKSRAPMKNKAVSLIPGIFSIVLGVVFVLLPARSAAFVYRITGGMLLIKVIGEYFVMIRNREGLSFVKDTIQQIKGQ